MEIEESIFVSPALKNISSIQLYQQGAEGRLFEGVFLGKPVIIKERFKKKYRHPVLDEKLTTKRIHSEGKFLQKLKAFGIDCPSVYYVDVINSLLIMERIEGDTVRNFLQNEFVIDPSWSENAKRLVREVGKNLALLHDKNVVHGDLTTSNLMIRSSSSNIVIIDFGLTFSSTLSEDKAVDLYVLERAFISTHINSEILVEELLGEYKKSSKNGADVIKRLDQVRQRGRKKLAFG